MPDAVTFRVQTYYKLARDEVGLTSVSSTRVGIAAAIDWLLDEIPAEAITFTVDKPEAGDLPVTTIVIDWAKVPDSVRAPKLAASRR